MEIFDFDFETRYSTQLERKAMNRDKKLKSFLWELKTEILKSAIWILIKILNAIKINHETQKKQPKRNKIAPMEASCASNDCDLIDFFFKQFSSEMKN